MHWIQNQGHFHSIFKDCLEADLYEERDPNSKGEEELTWHSEEAIPLIFPKDKPIDIAEQAGILHLVHCWPGQGYTGQNVCHLLSC